MRDVGGPARYSGLMSYSLEQTDAPAEPLDAVQSLSERLAAAGRAPHPWVQVTDEWGNLLRTEGIGEHFLLRARTVSAEGVRWWALGRETGPNTKVSLHLPNRVVKVEPHERLDLETVQRAFAHVLEAHTLPEDLARRPLDGDHGRMYLMVVGDDEPRPALGWTDVARRLTDVPAGEPVVAAIAEPGRMLTGIFGESDRLSITVRESRGASSWERRLRHVEGSGAAVELQLPQGRLEVTEADVLSREDTLIVLESLYRFDVPPPGYTWTVTP